MSEPDVVQHEQSTPPHDIDLTPYVDVRLQVVDRLWRMSIKHAQHAWDHRFRDPLAPHALAMLFLHNDTSRRDRWRVSAASRMWLAGEEVRDLPRLLFGLHKEFAGRAGGAGFDIRTELADRCDAGLHPDAIYCGLAVLSLDSSSLTWEQVQKTAQGVTDVGGSIRILLTDGTIMICRRARARDFAAFDVHSTRPLSYGALHSPVAWTRISADQVLRDEEHGEVLRWMRELSDTLSQADNSRVVAARAATKSAWDR